MTKGPHLRWRRWLVFLTGVLTILNLIIAYTPGLDNSGWGKVAQVGWGQGLPLGAACFAAFIAIFSNLENLYKFLDRPRGFRDAREVLLDAAVDLEV